MSEGIMTARKAAYEILAKIDKSGAYSNLELKSAYDKYLLSAKDRAFLKLLVHGVLEKKLLLEHIISSLATKKTDKRLVTIISLGLYQLIYTDIPESAAVNETVKLAEPFGRESMGFVNAVLRKTLSDPAQTERIITGAPKNIFYSLDESVYEILKGEFGMKLHEVMDAFAAARSVVVQPNTLKVTTDELKKLFMSKYISFSEDDYGIEIISGADKVFEMLSEGLYFIQGRASREAVMLLDACAGDFVIDTCACPGGKSFGAAVSMKNRGKVLSLDVHASKLPLIAAGAKTLGIDIISEMNHDSRKAIPELTGRADKVICDVPCSGLGMIGTKPEIRYKDLSNLTGLYRTQAEILASSASYLKPGGTLLYTTCTLNKKENGDQTEAFLRENKDFSLLYERTVLPYDKEKEGFYISLLQKK